MSDAPLPPTRRRVTLRRVIIFKLSAILGILIAILIHLKQSPHLAFKHISSRAPFPIEIHNGSWDGFSQLTLSEIRLGDFVRIQRLSLTWNWFDLLHKQRIERVEIDSPQVWSKPLAESLNSKNKNSSMTAFEIGTLQITNGAFFLQDLIPGERIKIPIGRHEPFILQEIRIGDALSAHADKLQTIKIHQLEISSPFDAIASVLDIETLQIEFTWKEIAEHRIRSISVTHPNLYLGPHLFDFVDALKKNKTQSPTAPWLIEQFKIKEGQLTVSAFGDAGATLPFFYECSSSNLRTDRLEEANAKIELKIPKSNQYFSKYDIRLHGLNGRVEFGLPFDQKKSQNVVNTVEAQSIEWKGITAQNPWFSITFDRRGIFGKIGATLYGGYFAGECGVFYQNGYPWFAILHGDKIDVKVPIEKLAQDHFELTGKMKLTLDVRAKSTIFERSTAKIELTDKGQMIIPAIDLVLQKLPDSWNSLKRESVRVGLEAFRTFDYTKGTLELLYDLPVSRAELNLEGKQGKRNFVINWNQE